MLTQDVVWMMGWMERERERGREGERERESGKSMQAARLDDDDDIHALVFEMLMHTRFLVY